MPSPINLKGVRAAREDAKRARSTAANANSDETATSDAGLPEGCPVVPLGKDDNIRYYLDADRQLAALATRDHSRLGVMGLFGNQSDLLEVYWPRHNKEGDVTGWAPELAAKALMAACSSKGVWDPSERQRGRGAWLGENGALVLHTGSHVMEFPPGPDPYVAHISHRAGLVGRYVYSAASPAGAPSADPHPGGPSGPAAQLLTMLETWRWRRAGIDPVLTLGWIGAAMIGGALKWRPMAWLTGGKGTGKSTLQELLKHLFGGGIIQTSDSTPAGLWQALRHQTLPVAFDELEAEEDNRRAAGVVKLARVAASGSLMLRGGAEHRGTEFTVRSAFLFSSILIPPLTPQDRSRITILDLDELTAGAAPPPLDAKKLAAIGAQLRRRLVDGWTRLDETLEHYRQSLQAAGHSARGADQLGTLLAAADLLLHDHAPIGETSEAWIAMLSATSSAEADDNARDEDRCLAHLMSAPLDVYRNGGRKSLAEWVRVAAGIDIGEDVDAARVLGTFGLKYVRRSTVDGVDIPAGIAFANFHQGLASLFVGTHWAGKSGTQGVWVQALRRLPGAGPSAKVEYFAGVSCRSTFVPIDVVIPRGSLPAQSVMV